MGCKCNERVADKLERAWFQSKNLCKLLISDKIKLWRCIDITGFKQNSSIRCAFWSLWIPIILTGISSCGKLAWVPISSSSCLILSTDCWFAGELRRLSSASWFNFGKGLNLKLLCEDAWKKNEMTNYNQYFDLVSLFTFSKNLTDQLNYCAQWHGFSSPNMEERFGMPSEWLFKRWSEMLSSVGGNMTCG